MEPKKLMIGITGTPNSGKRATARHIADELQLRQWQMLQPLLDAASAMTGIPLHHMAAAAMDTQIPALKTTLGQLIERLQITTRVMNHDFLVAHLSQRLHEQRGSMLFSGDLITGITTPFEAAWLRARGGLLVHLVSKSANKSYSVPKGDRDMIVYHDAAPTPEQLSQTLAQIRHAVDWHRRTAA